MCKAFFVRHNCSHASAPRVEKCPAKTRFGECNGVKRIEVKSPTLCSTCVVGLSSAQQRRVPAPSSATNLLAIELQEMAGKKIKKRYDWMNADKKPVQKTHPVKVHSQTRPNPETANAPEKAMPITTDGHVLTKADGKRARQAEARARNAAKKRDFHDALDEPSGEPVTMKRKAVEAQSTTALPTPSTTPTPPPSVKKPRKKAPPKSLTIADANTAPKPRPTTRLPSNPPPSPNSAIMTPKTKTITSLAKLNAALESKLRSFGYSPTLLHSGLFSPAEITRLAKSTYISVNPPGLRRSPRLTPEARAEAFLGELGRQIAGGVAIDGMLRTLIPPHGGKGDVELPDLDELDEFERAMMASPSPNPRTAEGRRVPGWATWNGCVDELFASSESEEE